MKTPAWVGVSLEDGLNEFTVPISGVQALICQSGTLESMVNVSELPLQWTASEATCEDGWGCQDTMLYIENGEKEPTGPKPDSHGTPGQISFPLPSPTCTLCWDSGRMLPSFQEQSPPQQEQPLSCPVASSPASHPNHDADPPGPWCPDPYPGLSPSLGPGPQVYLLLIKGCTKEEDQEIHLTQHRADPGLSIISYTQVCRRMDLCNDLSTSLPFWDLSPTPGAEGGRRGKGCGGDGSNKAKGVELSTEGLFT